LILAGAESLRNFFRNQQTEVRLPDGQLCATPAASPEKIMC
jgi:hypothetical protein